MSGWHVRDKLWPVRVHGSVLLYSYGSLGRGAQDGYLDFHTAPELWQHLLRWRSIIIEAGKGRNQSSLFQHYLSTEIDPISLTLSSASVKFAKCLSLSFKHVKGSKERYLLQNRTCELITPKIRILCFVLINNVPLNLLCVWISF